MHFKQLWQCNLCNLKPEMACIDQRLKSQRHQKMPSRAHCKSRRTSTTVSNYIHMALCHSQLCHSQLESWVCQSNSHVNDGPLLSVYGGVSSSHLAAAANGRIIYDVIILFNNVRKLEIIYFFSGKFKKLLHICVEIYLLGVFIFVLIF